VELDPEPRRRPRGRLVARARHAPTSMRVHLLPTLLLLCLGCAAARAGQLDIALDHYMAGKYAKAIGAADTALSTGTPSDEERARANLIKAQSYDKLGERDSALGLYQYVVDTYPQSPQAYQARRRIQQLERAGADTP
jgi:tetratricopeptide (TPR) repeat protein